jgi:hypothetical protein
MIKRLALFALLACCAGFAQTTTFTANTKDLATVLPATPEAGPVYLELTLRNCAGSGTTPTIPHVNGTGVVVFPVNLYPDGTGLVSKTVYDQTFIVCGSSAGVGYYHIRIYQGDNTRSLVKKLLYEDDFDVQGASFNLNSATPRSGSVITPPVATAVLTNPVGNQTIVQPVGTALSINHLSATFAQNANGADEITGNRFTDTSPTGNFLRFRNAAVNADMFAVDVTGQITAGIIPIARLSGGGSVYQTFQNAASSLTQRNTANFFAGITCVDNAGSTRTDCRLGTLTTVSFSATPTFDASTASTFKLTLTGNVTSSTLSNAVAGEPINIEICQDATGGRTFVPPANVQGWVTIPSGASACIMQDLVYDGTNAVASSAGTVEFASPPPIGSTTPNTGAFTTLSATGTSTLTNVNLGAANTLNTSNIQQVSATTAFCIRDNLGVCHIFIAGSTPFTNLFLQGNGGGVVFLGSAAKTSVADTTGIITMSGATSGTTSITPSAAASGTLTLPAATDTLVGKATTDTLTNKTIATPVQGAACQGNCIATVPGYARAVSQTAAIGATTLFTTGGADTLYLVQMSVNCRSASASATVLGNILWTDVSGTALTAPTTTATCTTLNINAQGGMTISIQAKAGTTIQYSTSITNTPTYDVRVAITQPGTN